MHPELKYDVRYKKGNYRTKKFSKMKNKVDELEADKKPCTVYVGHLDKISKTFTWKPFIILEKMVTQHISTCAYVMKMSSLL